MRVFEYSLVSIEANSKVNNYYYIFKLKEKVLLKIIMLNVNSYIKV